MMYLDTVSVWKLKWSMQSSENDLNTDTSESVCSSEGYSPYTYVAVVLEDEEGV